MRTIGVFIAALVAPALATYRITFPAEGDQWTLNESGNLLKYEYVPLKDPIVFYVILHCPELKMSEMSYVSSSNFHDEAVIPLPQFFNYAQGHTPGRKYRVFLTLNNDVHQRGPLATSQEFEFDTTNVTATTTSSTESITTSDSSYTLSSQRPNVPSRLFFNSRDARATAEATNDS